MWRGVRGAAMVTLSDDDVEDPFPAPNLVTRSPRYRQPPAHTPPTTGEVVAWWPRRHLVDPVTIVPAYNNVINFLVEVPLASLLSGSATPFPPYKMFDVGRRRS